MGIGIRSKTGQHRVLCAVLVAACAVATTGAATASADPLPADSDRIGVLQGGAVFVKEGQLDAQWNEEWGGSAAKFQISGDMIGVLTTSGELYVKQGALNAGWVDEIGGVADFQLEGTADRIGVLRTDGTVAVKDGGLYGSWDEETNNVTELRLSGDRIGVLHTDGTTEVKEGTLAAPWVGESNNTTDLELSADRIGVLQSDGTVLVKETNLFSNWVTETNNVQQLVLDGSMIGVVFTGGVASVKEGNLYGDWVNQTNNVANLQLAGDRIGVLSTSGAVAVKDGGLYGSWEQETSGVGELRLAASVAAATGGAQVTIADIAAIWGPAYATDTVAAGLPGLNAVMTSDGITSPTRKAALLATLKHESGIRYNAGEAGNSSAYRGRGFIQLTGVSNYSAAGAALGHDFVDAPDDAATLAWSANIAGWYWTVARNIDFYADRYDMGGVDNQVGYSTSLDPTEENNRCADYQSALAYFNGGTLPVPASQINCLR